jgi:LysR family transcriptional regulator, glycine cleavage system transcriptional activator
MIENLPFGALRIFESASRHLSFKQAAEELFITPAAVSQQIKSLEHQLGVKLFNRHNRGLSLTDAAKQGLPLLTSSFDGLKQAVDLIREARQEPRLTIWMAPSFASKWFVPRLQRFAERHPDIDLDISASPNLVDPTASNVSIPVENFRRDNVDIAIRFGKGIYPGCRVDKLFAVSAIPLCSPELMRGKHSLETPEDLRFHTLIHDNTRYEGRPDWATWLKAAGVDGIDTDRGLHFNHGNLAINAAVDGQGVVLSMKSLASGDIAAGRLVAPFNLSLPLEYAYYMITLEALTDQPHTAAFRNWLLQEAVLEDDSNSAG